MEQRRRTDIIARVFEDIENSKTIESATESFAIAAGVFGYQWFWLVHISNRPGLANGHYRRLIGRFPPPTPLNRNLVNLLPEPANAITKALLTSDGSIVWNELVAANPGDLDLRERSAAFAAAGIANGVTVPFRRWDGSVWAVSIAGDETARTDRSAVLALQPCARSYAATTVNLLGAINSSAKAGMTKDLTERHLTVIRFLAEGHNAAETAAKLGITVRGVEYLLSQARHRVGARTTIQLVHDVMGRHSFEPRPDADSSVP